MLVLIYLASRMVPAKFPAWRRPARVTFWVTTIFTGTYGVLGVIYLLFRLFDVRILF